MRDTPNDRQVGYSSTGALPMLGGAEAYDEAFETALASKPRPVDNTVPRTAWVDLFTMALLAWGSIGDARRKNIQRWVWELARHCAPSYGFAASDLLAWPSVHHFINTAAFTSEPQRYAAFKVLRRLGRNLSPETWTHPVAARSGPVVDLAPYSQEELDYFEALRKTLDWEQYGQRFLMVFLLAIAFGLSAPDIAVAHGADCRISRGPVRIYTTFGKPRLIPADETYASRMKYHIKKRKDSYLVQTGTAMPSVSIVSGALRPTPLVEANAKLPTIPRLASTWRYRRLIAGLPVPAITYLAGRETHSWLNHFGAMPIGLREGDFERATKAPEPHELKAPSWFNRDDIIEDTSLDSDTERFPSRSDKEDPFETNDADVDQGWRDDGDGEPIRDAAEEEE